MTQITEENKDTDQDGKMKTKRTDGKKDTHQDVKMKTQITEENTEQDGNMFLENILSDNYQ